MCLGKGHSWIVSLDRSWDGEQRDWTSSQMAAPEQEVIVKV